MLGDRIKELRLEKGLSQAKLSLQLGFGKSMIGMIESGKRNVSQENIQKIANYFNVSIDYLLGRTDIKSNEKSKLIDEFISSLVNEGIIKNVNDIDKETEEMILNAVKLQISLKLKKKNS